MQTSWEGHPRHPPSLAPRLPSTGAGRRREGVGGNSGEGLGGLGLDYLEGLFKVWGKFPSTCGCGSGPPL